MVAQVLDPVTAGESQIASPPSEWQDYDMAAERFRA